MSKSAGLNLNRTHNDSLTVLLVGLTAITLYFNTKANDPFNTPKLIILIILGAWLMGPVISHYRRNSWKSNKFLFSLLLFLAFFLLSQLWALIMTDSFYIGFVGDTQRRNGFISYLSLSIILLYTSIKFNLLNSNLLLQFCIFIGLVSVSYGMFQINGADFVDWANPHNSMIGTLGNPNFASSLHAILVLCAIFVVIYKPINTVFKFFAIPVAIFGVFTIYSSNSRQGLVVIGVGIVSGVSLYVWFNFRKLRLIVIPLAIIVSLIAVLGMLQIGPAAYYLYKASLSVRGFYWQAAFEMLKVFPLTGVGLDSYGSYFKEFRSQDYPIRYGYDITSTNAHNTFFQMFATGGIFLGLSYLLLTLYILYVGLVSIKQSLGEERKLSIFLLSTWIAFQSQSIISIDNVGISIWGWVLGGAILGLQSNRGLSYPTIRPNKNINRINLSQFLTSTFFLIPIVLLSFTLHRQEADLFVAKAGTLQNPIKRELVVFNANKVLNNHFVDPYYRFEAAMILYDFEGPVFARTEIQNLSTQNPRNLYFLDWLVKIEINNKNYVGAIEYVSQIEKYDPWNARNVFLKGELYKLLDNKIKMEEMRLKVNRIAPNSEISMQANLILV
jgi:O-antigen ligase